MILRYFGIRFTDLGKSVKFYSDLLGLKILRSGTMPHVGKWVLLEDPRSHQKSELNWYPTNSPYAPKYEPGEGLDHIGLKIKSPASTFQDLKEKGAKPALTPDDINGVKGIYYIKDPDVNWLEFF